MKSFKDTREMIVIAYAEKLLTDEEFLFLYEANKPVNLELPYYEYEEFNLEENISEAKCKGEFRFERGDIERLADVLQLPPTFECPQGSVCDRVEGLCILLHRLVHPCHYSDMVSGFARPVPILCMISNIVLNHIYDLHHWRITAWNQVILNPLALQQYADAVSDKGAALDDCFGFVDGTVNPICRPGEHQRMVYNGHKRVHVPKFQAVALPNSLIGQLFGPVEGKRHDAAMLADSDLLTALEQYAVSPTGQAMCIYEDPGYPLRVNLKADLEVRP